MYSSNLSKKTENISDILFYNKNPLLIKYLSNFIGNIGNIFQLNFSRNITHIEISKIKEIINFIETQNTLLLSKNYKIYRVNLRKKYNIDKSIIYSFTLSDSLITEKQEVNIKILIIYFMFTFYMNYQ